MSESANNQARRMDCYVCGRGLHYFHQRLLQISDVICSMCQPKIDRFPKLG